MRALIAMVAILVLSGCEPSNSYWTGEAGMTSCLKLATVEEKMSTREGREALLHEEATYRGKVKSWAISYALAEWADMSGEKAPMLKDGTMLMLYLTQTCKNNTDLDVREAMREVTKKIIAEHNSSK